MQIVDQYYIQRVPFPVLSRILNYFVEFYSFLMFIWLNWTYLNSFQLGSNSMYSHSQYIYHAWMKIEVYFVIAFMFANMLVLAGYWIKH